MTTLQRCHSGKLQDCKIPRKPRIWICASLNKSSVFTHSPVRSKSSAINQHFTINRYERILVRHVLFLHHGPQQVVLTVDELLLVGHHELLVSLHLVPAPAVLAVHLSLVAPSELEVEPDPGHEPQLVIEDSAPGPLLAYEGALGLVLVPALHAADLATVTHEAALLAPGEAPAHHRAPAELAHGAPAQVTRHQESGTETTHL